MYKLNRFIVKILLSLSIVPVASFAATPWQACGNLSQMNVANGGTISGKPLSKYEYAIAYNSTEPVPVIATNWNYGIRIYNKSPYFVVSDNPENMKMGGFVFYSGTQASDDNCGQGNFRHKYWYINTDGGVVTDWSNGCYGSTGDGAGSSNPIIYCRLR